MSLRDTTNILLRASDVGSWLRLADSYIQAYNRIPQQFVLPADHALLKPIIESFASDVVAFSAYVRALRDAIEDGTAKDELHDLYRMTSMRGLQQERRARINKAATILTEQVEPVLGRELTYEDRLQMARFIEHRWGDMRLTTMAEERKLRNSKRLTTEERNIVLHDFWKTLDTALENGVVPLGDEGEITELALLLTK